MAQKIQSVPNPKFSVAPLTTIAADIVSRRRVKVPITNPTKISGYRNPAGSAQNYVHFDIADNESFLDMKKMKIVTDFTFIGPHPHKVRFDGSNQSIIAMLTIGTSQGLKIEEIASYNLYANIIESVTDSALHREYNIFNQTCQSSLRIKEKGQNRWSDPVSEFGNDQVTFYPNRTYRIHFTLNHSSFLENMRMVPLPLFRNGLRFTLHFECAYKAFVHDIRSVADIPREKVSYYTRIPTGANYTALLSANRQQNVNWIVPGLYEYGGANVRPNLQDVPNAVRWLQNGSTELKSNAFLAVGLLNQLWQKIRQELTLLSPRFYNHVYIVPIRILMNDSCFFTGFTLIPTWMFASFGSNPDINNIIQANNVPGPECFILNNGTWGPAANFWTPGVNSEGLYCTCPLFATDRQNTATFPLSDNIQSWYEFNQLFLVHGEIELDYEGAYLLNVPINIGAYALANNNPDTWQIPIDPFQNGIAVDGLMRHQALSHPSIVDFLYVGLTPLQNSWSYTLENTEMILDLVKPSTDIFLKYQQAYQDPSGIPVAFERVIYRKSTLSRISGMTQVGMNISVRSLTSLLIVLQHPKCDFEPADSTKFSLPCLSSFMRFGLTKAEVIVGGQVYPVYPMNLHLVKNTTDNRQNHAQMVELENVFGVSGSGGFNSHKTPAMTLGNYRNYSAFGSFDYQPSQHLPRTLEMDPEMFTNITTRGLLLDASNFILGFSLAKDDNMKFASGIDSSQSGSVMLNLYFEDNVLQHWPADINVDVHTFVKCDAVLTIQNDANLVRF